MGLIKRMLLFSILGLALAQIEPGCERWQQVDNKIQLNGVPIFDLSSSFLFIGTGNLNIGDFRGTFWVNDYTESRKPLAVKDVRLSNDDKFMWVDFEDNIRMHLSCISNGAYIYGAQESTSDRIWLRFYAEENEGVYGGGEQYSFFNIRGERFEMLTREQGMGRNYTELVSYTAERVAPGSKGEFDHSYWPQPVFIVSSLTDRHFYVDFHHDEYSVLDFTNDDFYEIELHYIESDEQTIEFNIDTGSDYQDTNEKLALSQGTQQRIPKWVVDGTIIGVQGGTEMVEEYIQNATQYDISVRGVWIQDWAGQIFTDFGDRVFWNWEWNETQYPALDQKIIEYGEKGTYFLNYLNPHLLNTNTSKLYVEGHEKGYFVKNRTTGGDLEQEFGFSPYKVVTIDLSWPEARNWFKQKIIIENTINFGFKGWMADFGEYLPYSEDALFWDGTDGRDWHNKYPERWANLNMEALIETGTLGDCFYFSRAGWTGMRASSTSAWAGDQNVDFSYGDGLPTTVTSALSLGASGFGLTHFDIGGYTGFSPLKRTRELFMRSAEAAVFTPVMRTHEGNQPAENWQYYSSRCSMRLYSRLVKIHQLLVPYIEQLVTENTELGRPVQRPMLWAAKTEEERERFANNKFQYLLGDDMVVAPVLDRNTTTWTVDLPYGNWRDIWVPEMTLTGPTSVTVQSEVGYPPAFYRLESDFADDFSKIAQFYGSLPCNIPYDEPDFDLLV